MNRLWLGLVLFLNTLYSLIPLVFRCSKSSIKVLVILYLVTVKTLHMIDISLTLIKPYINHLFLKQKYMRMLSYSFFHLPPPVYKKRIQLKLCQ